MDTPPEVELLTRFPSIVFPLKHVVGVDHVPARVPLRPLSRRTVPLGPNSPWFGDTALRLQRLRRATYDGAPVRVALFAVGSVLFADAVAPPISHDSVYICLDIGTHGVSPHEAPCGPVRVFLVLALVRLVRVDGGARTVPSIVAIPTNLPTLGIYNTSSVRQVCFAFKDSTARNVCVSWGQQPQSWTTFVANGPPAFDIPDTPLRIATEHTHALELAEPPVDNTLRTGRIWMRLPGCVIPVTFGLVERDYKHTLAEIFRSTGVVRSAGVARVASDSSERSAGVARVASDSSDQPENPPLQEPAEMSDDRVHDDDAPAVPADAQVAQEYTPQQSIDYNLLEQLNSVPEWPPTSDIVFVCNEDGSVDMDAGYMNDVFGL